MSNHLYVDPKIQKVIQLYGELLSRDFYSLPIRRKLYLQADRLTEAHRNRDDAVCFQIASWHPNLVGKSDARILEHVFGIDDGKLTIAREYGFKNWDDVESMQDRQSDVAFEIAVDTMLSGNLRSLKRTAKRSTYAPECEIRIRPQGDAPALRRHQWSGILPASCSSESSRNRRLPHRVRCRSK